MTMLLKTLSIEDQVCERTCESIYSDGVKVVVGGVQ